MTPQPCRRLSPRHFYRRGAEGATPSNIDAMPATAGRRADVHSQHHYTFLRAMLRWHDDALSALF